MNEQKPPNAIEWTRAYGRRGYTWNVVAGCKHDCQWQMPGGDIAQCYAKTTAEKFTAAYPHGFEHHYWHPERLTEPLKVKEPSGIFVDSMSDLMGAWVQDSEIQSVLDVCAEADHHIFFLLTKNAPRLLQFEFPPNVWVGASVPPDFMFGNRLSRDQQSRMLHRILRVLSDVRAKVRWISFEPLSWDCSQIVSQYPDALQWSVIGAASNGRKEYPPDIDDLLALLNVLDGQGCPIFYKGNMRALERTRHDWRSAFPVREVDKLVQLTLF